MRYSEKIIRCPFYINSNDKQIRCEGLFSSDSVHRFTDMTQKANFFRNYCCGDYRKCPAATILEKKYE